MQVPDRIEGNARKQAGQQLALDFSGVWRDLVLAAFADWLQAQKALGLKTVTIEAFRAQAQVLPASHKAWGALPRALCSAGLIAEHLDGEGNPVYVRAASPKTHAHPVRVWRVL